ncbi:MAG: hypothetical protein V3T17_01765 [Pseudomonadales bacterium]
MVIDSVLSLPIGHSGVFCTVLYVAIDVAIDVAIGSKAVSLQ